MFGNIAEVYLRIVTTRKDFMEINEKVWTGCMWLRRGTIGGLL
jgi:hypothetical protein